MEDKVRFFVDAEEAVFDYRVEGDGSAILLRSKRDFPLFPNTMDMVDVSPVSRLYPRVPLLSPLVEFYVLAGFMAIYFAMCLAYICIDCCCQRRLLERRRRREAERAHRRHMQAVARWRRHCRRPTQFTLKSLAAQSLIRHMRPPVKRNLWRTQLPKSVIIELVELRRDQSVIV